MKNKNINFVKSKLVGPIISFATLFLCLGLLELTGYVWETKTAQGSLGWTLVGARRLKLERYGDDNQPYFKFKSNEYYNWEGIPVHINSLGFRGEEFSVQKPSGVYRILNLGDSVAFGWEVRQENTYGSILEKMLNSRDDGITYEVINAGIPTLNLEAERNLLLNEGLSYQPDLVILDITVVNDIYGAGPNIQEAPSLFQWLRDHTYGWPFLTTNLRFLLAKRVGPEAIPVLNPPKEASWYYPLEENDKTWDKLWKYIEDMYIATRDAGSDFVLVIFPTTYQLNSARHPDVPQKVLSERSELVGLEYVDLLPLYKKSCDEAELNACEGYENLLFADVWMHPNGLGHALAAEQLFQLIVSIR